MKRCRVAVTGLGVVSSIGIGRQAFWQALLAGQSGISDVTAFDTTDFPTHRGGEVKDFHPEKFISPDKLKRYNRASQFAIAAAKMALQDAELNSSSLVGSGKVGVLIGTTMAETQALESMDKIWMQKGAQSIPPRLVTQYPGNMIGAYVAEVVGLVGLNVVIGTACAAGNYALAYGYDLLRLGRADIVIAGGTDAFSRVAFTGFNRLLAVAPERCQPFDKHRKGMMVGEGAGMLILERADDAVARGVRVYAEILGYGLSCDASHMTIPEMEGMAHAMRNAVNDAEISLDDVGYVSAHGTGTSANDRTECAALRKVFGNQIDHTPVSSIKSMIGHTMGAASALEAIACVLAVKHNQVPPTINFETPDPDCDIDCIPNVGRSHRVNVALNDSFAFGGNNACLAFGKSS